ncbi:BP74-related protein [Abyssalbus ytuae]|uniref:BP74 N-terminal domain-containing protein n=1 Tax=Abyssalbus ytuae TaxID=2926907 RepID=A0A9E6ZW80_9FLAO|nr:hypothetical protein [Abyssalbus ytuae]UOB17941.1 hypothetical protein MQE35_01260 [Abyssalbus ytuae]
MKKYHLLKKFIFLIYLFSFSVYTSCSNDDNDENRETIRYFRFHGCAEVNHGNWQDTSFIAATAKTDVIEKCIQQLQLPLEERNLFPLGKIKEGNGGYNKNASHNFSWHFVEEEWDMAEFGIEIYDGCPYSDAELADYEATLGSYGGWGNRIAEEIEVN